MSRTRSAIFRFLVNIRFVFEGMEESGSVGLPELVRSLAVPGGYLDPKVIDFCCISDNYYLGKSKPCLTHGLRGTAYFHASIQSSTRTYIAESLVICTNV